MNGVYAVVFMMALYSTFASAGSKSVYTDLDKSCKEFDGEEDHYSRMNCGSVGSFSLLLEWDDERNSLTLKTKNKEMPLDLFHLGNGGFNTVQGKVEWRVAKGEPYALIARMKWDEGKKAGKLLVVRIESARACLIGTIHAAIDKNANESARTLADNQTKTCASK